MVLLIALAGCIQRTLPPRPVDIPSPARVAVLPFRVDLGAGGDPDAAPVPEETGASTARLLTERLDAAGIAVVGADAVRRAVPGPAAEGYDAQRARTIADAVGANVLVVGTLRHYVERQGSGLGVTAPASVAYEVVVVRASDGAVLGNDRFDYTQAPLNENLLDLPLFLEGGARWRTRAEILERALGDTARRLARWLGGKPTG